MSARTLALTVAIAKNIAPINSIEVDGEKFGVHYNPILRVCKVKWGEDTIGTVAPVYVGKVKYYTPDPVLTMQDAKTCRKFTRLEDAAKKVVVEYFA